MRSSRQIVARPSSTVRLPLALRCWYEQVGQVNLMGRHPAWKHEYLDPLVVEAPVEYVLSEHELWRADRGTEWDRGAFVIDLAPDHLHKADVSGGAPYAMAVPNEAPHLTFNGDARARPGH